jgi:hypothetical protein
MPSIFLRFNYSDLAKDFEKPILMKLDINGILYFRFAFVASVKELNDIPTLI